MEDPSQREGIDKLGEYLKQFYYIITELKMVKMW
jgi:hypothetical protein